MVASCKKAALHSQPQLTLLQLRFHKNDNMLQLEELPALMLKLLCVLTYHIGLGKAFTLSLLWWVLLLCSVTTFLLAVYIFPSKR